ncbi:transcription activator-related [Euphorbia peplus]|nr:transcription activator-related [Euphorbia peplus]
MENDREKEEREGTLNQPPQMSPMKPVTHDAYGGGMYAYEAEQHRNQLQNQTKKPASDTQSADGPVDGPVSQPKHQPPPSTGDRDVDITGQSYIQ